jgi:dTDP-4-dehydrorhamnose 3,5-epimerase
LPCYQQIRETTIIFFIMFEQTPFPGLLIFDPKVFEDSRGYFFESFNAKIFEEAGITDPFVQDNQARSVYGVVRGLHYQVPPFAQAKLVRCLEGAVLDVVVDIRPDSPMYGLSYSILLTAENRRQLYVPRGFAHGYAVLSETAVFFYKCDNYYSKAHEGGILWNDPSLGIDWQVELEKVVLSEKDLLQPDFGAHRPFA